MARRAKEGQARARIGGYYSYEVRLHLVVDLARGISRAEELGTATACAQEDKSGSRTCTCTLRYARKRRQYELSIGLHTCTGTTCRS